MEVYELNPNLTAFYFDGDTDPENEFAAARVGDNWAKGTCAALGVAVYAVHKGQSALVYDTLCSPEQAFEVQTYLEKKLRITKFTVALSHWHLDHVGGNELYRDFNIVACCKTREALLLHREAIEAGSLWGEPAIKPLRLPDIVFENSLSIYLDDLEVALYNFNIHSEDSVCAYIPKYKILLPGDMLEDSAPYVTNPEGIPEHLKNFALLRQLNVQRILPNHGRSVVIKSGGYSTGLIDFAAEYLADLHARLRANPTAAVPDLRTFAAKHFSKGTIHYWPPYEAVHEGNIERVRSFIKGG